MRRRLRRSGEQRHEDRQGEGNDKPDGVDTHVAFSSTNTSSMGLSPVSCRCSWAGDHRVCPAFTLNSSVFPPGRVNVPWLSVKKTAMPGGCPCITDFSCGP